VRLASERLSSTRAATPLPQGPNFLCITATEGPPLPPRNTHIAAAAAFALEGSSADAAWPDLLTRRLHSCLPNPIVCSRLRLLSDRLLAWGLPSTLRLHVGLSDGIIGEAGRIRRRTPDLDALVAHATRAGTGGCSLGPENDRPRPPIMTGLGLGVWCAAPRRLKCSCSGGPLSVARPVYSQGCPVESFAQPSAHHHSLSPRASPPRQR
jgi:hypothetical protein